MPENPNKDVSNVNTGIVSKTGQVSNIEGELPCIIIYSSEKHVKYIPSIIYFVKDILQKKGFKVKLLSDETRDFSRYSDEFIKIANECVYGVILLDGFRPNVLFEFGILLGLKKPISVLMSEDAEIAVRTLYENHTDAGLSPAEFRRLKNPNIRLGSSNHFSDLSTHISCFKPDTYFEKEEHVSKKLEDSIERKKSEIIEEFKKVSSKSVAGINPDYLQKYQNTLFNLLQYYTGTQKYDANDVESLYMEIKNLEKMSGMMMPSESRVIIASLYNSLSEKMRSDVE